MDKYSNEDINSLNEYQWQNLTSSTYGHKSLDKTKDIARTVKETNPDILCLVEVGGKASLENFSKYFLDNQYEIYHLPSNSDRGIDLGYLVKKELPYSFHIYAHTNVKLKNGKRPARGFFQLDVKDKKNNLLTIFLTHLKSKLDLDNSDFEGRGQRQAEVEYLGLIASKQQKKNPTLIAGDLNGIIYKELTEFELKPFKDKFSFIDGLEVKGVPVDQRFSYVYFKGAKPVKMQLDYILCHEENAKNVCNAAIIPYKTPYGTIISPPKNMLERSYFPSDHYPLAIDFTLNN